VLAGPSFDADGLDARLANAGIDAAGVLENVGLAARAVHFDRVAIGQVWHGKCSWKMIRLPGLVCNLPSTSFTRKRGWGLDNLPSSAAC
jgi:hypothetical protein